MSGDKTDAKSAKSVDPWGGKSFFQSIPHVRALDITPVDTGPGQATLRLPYNAALAGHPASGILHGGAITTLVDTACGMAVFLAMRQPEPIATLDLRIDHIRAPTPGSDVLCRAHCYRVAREIAFVEAEVIEAHTMALVARSIGTFIRTSSPQRREAEQPMEGRA